MNPAHLGERADQLCVDDHLPNPDLAQSIQCIEDGLREALLGFEQEDRLLFLLIIERGMKRNAAARFLGWPDPAKATRRMQKLCETISSVVDRVTGGGSDETDRVQIQVWGKILSRILQDDHSSTSNTKDEQVQGTSEPLRTRSQSK